MKSPSGTNLLLKAIEILDAVSGAETPPRLTEIVKRTGLPVGTAHRILDTLTSKRLLRRDESSRAYRLGPKLLQLARGAWEDYDVRAAAHPELDALHEQLGHTLLLAVLVDDNLVVIDRRQERDAFRGGPAIGASLSLHSTAAGKAMMSALDLAQMAQMVFAMTLAPVTARTITDAETLRAHLEVAASNHYAIDDEESSLGIRGCAAPILSQQGKPLAVIAYSGPAEMLSVSKCGEVGGKLAVAAERISWNLGYTPPERWADLAISRRTEPVERVGSALAFVGINPLWCHARKGLLWSDRTRSTVYFDRADGTGSTYPLAAPCHGLVECGADALLLQPDGLHKLDLDTGRIEHVHAVLGSDPQRRYVTARCDDRGRLWITTMDPTLSRATGRLYRIDPDGTPHCMVDGLLFPLGLSWSPDGSLIYFTDGPKREIYCAPVEPTTGNIGTVRVFARVPDGMGRPTGLAVDEDGFVWNAHSEGWRVTRYTPSGGIDHVLQLPVSRPIDCGFGGEDFKTLFITTARQGIPERRLTEVPLSGAVLAYRTTTAGLGLHPLSEAYFQR